MQDNAIAAIESAELESKQILQKAGEQKLTLIREAKERQLKEYMGSIAEAQAKSRLIIEASEAEIKASQTLMDSELEAFKAELMKKAKNNEAAAIGNVIELIGGKPL